MRDENPIRTARRSSRREHQNRCMLCGRRRQIERHHVAGKNHDPPLIAPLCLACHALATENLRRADIDMRFEPNSVERVRKSLNATAVFIQLLSDALFRWADSLPR
jgi:hypothetical protein